MNSVARILCTFALSVTLVAAVDGRRLRGLNQTRTLRKPADEELTGRRLNETDGERRLNESKRLLNETRRFLNETDEVRRLQGLTDEEVELMEGDNPCDRVLPFLGSDLSARTFCRDYELLPYIMPECPPEDVIVPMIYHSVGKDDKQLVHQQITAMANPDFIRNHHGDDSALEYIRDWCGPDVASAYACMAAPAYRADIFRFCALYSQGGVYLDNDMMPLVQLTELYSPCSVATVGHDQPQGGIAGGEPGKQMKILAGAPGAPIFKCMLNRIVENVKRKAHPDSCLAISGPTLLHQCYTQNSDNVAITYHDTRSAHWPYSGMRRGNKVISYEIAVGTKHFEVDTTDYGFLFERREIYKDECPLLPKFSFPSVEDRVKYYMKDWYENRKFDTVRLCTTTEYYNESTDWSTVHPQLYDSTTLQRMRGLYFDDIAEHLLPHWAGPDAIFLMHLGDIRYRYLYPVLTKTRPARWSPADEDDQVVDPIIVPVNMERHYGGLNEVSESDMPWEEKKDILVWRGAATGHGARTQALRSVVRAEGVDVGIAYNPDDVVQMEPHEFDPADHDLIKNFKSMKEQLSYKYLLSLEGNDVASGLKWMLYSNSVVLMPRPQFVTWAMEDQLVPWYHYIPLEADLSDLSEKLQWARDHDEDCWMIAQQATQYIDDLWMSDKAQDETEKIVAGIVSRYQEQYGDVLHQCPKSGKAVE